MDAWLRNHLPRHLDSLITRIALETADVESQSTDGKSLDAVLIREQGLDVTRPQIWKDLVGLTCWRQMAPTVTTIITAPSTNKNPKVVGQYYLIHVSA